jgi:hypothetical protein
MAAAQLSGCTGREPLFTVLREPAFSRAVRAGEPRAVGGLMNEGWHGDEHFIVLTDDEAREATERYGLSERLAGFQIVGLRGWDDFILRDSNGRLFTGICLPPSASERSNLMSEVLGGGGRREGPTYRGARATAR